MKVLVPIKRVIDYNVVVQIRPDHKDVVMDHVKMSINPFDEIALEEAIRLQEAGHADDIIVVSVGEDCTEEQLRQALAMGAHRGILVKTDNVIANDPLCVAKTLAKVVQRESIDLVLMGKQAIDNDCNQVGQMLAGLLDWSQATFASQLKFTKSGLEVAREVDGGTEHVRFQLPAIVTADLRLNEPRYISLPNIMKAKQKPLDHLSLSELHLSLQSSIDRIRLDYPKSRQAGEIFQDTDAFLKKLDEDGIWD